MNRLATFAGYAGFVLVGWNAVLVAALIRSIQPDVRPADAAFGLFFFVSALLYAAGSFGGGFLTERVGRRAVLALATLLLGVGLGGEGQPGRCGGGGIGRVPAAHRPDGDADAPAGGSGADVLIDQHKVMSSISLRQAVRCVVPHSAASRHSSCCTRPTWRARAMIAPCAVMIITHKADKGASWLGRTYSER